MHGEERPFLAPVIDLFNFGQALYPPPPPPPLPTPHSAPPRPPRPTPPTPLHPARPPTRASILCPAATTGGHPCLVRRQAAGLRGQDGAAHQGGGGAALLLRQLLHRRRHQHVRRRALPFTSPFHPRAFPHFPSHPTTSLSSPYFPSHTLTGTASRPRARRRARRRAPPRSKPADSPRASHGPRARVLPRALSAINRLQAPRGASAALRGYRRQAAPSGSRRRRPGDMRPLKTAAPRVDGSRWPGVPTPLYAITVCAARTQKSTHTLQQPRAREVACAAGAPARERSLLSQCSRTCSYI